MSNSNTKKNIDEHEVEKFEKLANRWWDKNSEFKPLHEINPLRANYINERSPVEEKKLIDIGCGGGLICEAMTKFGASVTGIDAGETPIQVAKMHSLESELSIDYQQITAEEFVEKNDTQFDIVTCLEMLEHVPNPASVIQACAKLCKPGGDIYLSTINRNPKAYLFAIIGAEHLLRLLPTGTHNFDKFIKPSELEQWARYADLKINNMVGMTYNPITKIYKLNPNDVDVNYMIHFTKAL